MTGAGWVIAAISPVVAASFVYLFKLFKTADAMRKQIADCAPWTEHDFPTGVADIEGRLDWSTLVGGYYVALEDVYTVIRRASIIALGLMVIGAISILAAGPLSQIHFRGNVSGLAFTQVSLVAAAVGYLVWVTLLVNAKSKTKGQLDLAVSRCRRSAERPTTGVVTVAASSTEVPSVAAVQLPSPPLVGPIEPDIEDTPLTAKRS